MRRVLGRLLFSVVLAVSLASGFQARLWLEVHPDPVAWLMGTEAPVGVVAPVVPESVPWGRVLLEQRAERISRELSAVAWRLGCPQPADWPVGSLPTVMIVVSVGEFVDLTGPVSYELRPWSFEGLAGKFEVWALCA